MLKQLFEEQRKSLQYFFDSLAYDKVEELFGCCLESKGQLIFTGVGKSAIIAEKIAMTLISTGTRALYLPAMNFLHGDMGVVTSADIFFFLSKSGETEELLELVPFVKKKGASVVAVLSYPQSKLAREAHFVIHLPMDKELCPFDLAPTISTEIQLLFGDVLAIWLMKKRRIQMEEYAANHPSGTIGKKATVKVEDLMLKGKEIPFCYPEDKLEHVLVELSSKKCGCLVIVDKAYRLQGIFTDGDLRRALQKLGTALFDKTMQELMTPTAESIKTGLLVWEALKIMQKDNKWITTLPVIETNKVVGILRMHDIVHAGLA